MFSRKLKELYSRHLNRIVRDRSSPQGAKISIGGRAFLNFASNDYLGLANHPELIDAAEAAMRDFGLGSGASRLLSGGSILHKKLEDTIAKIKGTEAARIFNSGHAANTGIIPSLAGEEDIIFSDELNHASIVDGCRLSKAKTLVYRHRDTTHLGKLMEKASAESCRWGKGRYIVVTDTVFSMDGDIAPLKEIHDLCAKHKALLYIDDAHGTGVIGDGKGALAHFSILPKPWIIQMGTFSNALGSYGGFATGSKEVIKWITNSSRSFLFSTALPPCIVAASLKSLEIIGKRPYLVEKLWQNRNRLIRSLAGRGYPAVGETPIIPLRIGDIDKTLAASRYLYKKGIYVPAIRPPTVKEPRLRITVTAAHSAEDIDSLVHALSGM
ncbi:MAG TPA: 8-amino-7-oxononanoate synthase [Nitrospiraceae bacterium]|nr:8-amino-7-oxononanoate synthase [Nitrospiraceae bacterium]